jgi:5-methyltetrahydropteroyltriglutamate--homocysteine methyltransferase
MTFQEIWPAIDDARVGGLSLEFANPRHPHEHDALKRYPLPTEMSLLPAVIDSTSNYVEHSHVIANRICEAVAAVGDRTRVIASSGCGFGTFAGGEFLSSDVVLATGDLQRRCPDRVGAAAGFSASVT